MNGQRAKELRRRNAELRFSIIGGLLASPPPRGQLWPAIEALAAQRWRHPCDGRWVRFGASSIERWYYAARGSADPLHVLGRKIRKDAVHLLQDITRLTHGSTAKTWIKALRGLGLEV